MQGHERERGHAYHRVIYNATIPAVPDSRVALPFSRLNNTHDNTIDERVITDN